MLGRVPFVVACDVCAFLQNRKKCLFNHSLEIFIKFSKRSLLKNTIKLFIVQNSGHRSTLKRAGCVQRVCVLRGLD